MSRRWQLAAAFPALLIAWNTAAAERCGDRRIVQFGETVRSIAQRCGVTPGAIERQNPGLHINGVRTGMHINVPRPALPTPRVQIRNGTAVSGGSGSKQFTLR